MTWAYFAEDKILETRCNPRRLRANRGGVHMDLRCRRGWWGRRREWSQNWASWRNEKRNYKIRTHGGWNGTPLFFNFRLIIEFRKEFRNFGSQFSNHHPRWIKLLRIMMSQFWRHCEMSAVSWPMMLTTWLLPWVWVVFFWLELILVSRVRIWTQWLLWKWSPDENLSPVE